METSARGYSKLLSGLILATTLMAVGCSSGGGNGLPASDSSSSSGAMTDTTPDAFSFAPKRDVEVNAAIDSEAVTITGINAAAEVEITPPAEYQIDDGEFTSEPGTVNENQTITVRLPSAAKAEQTTSATLTVGDQTATFDVTTAADMTAPEVAIQFPPPASMTEGDTIYIRGESSDLHGSVANITINGEMVTTEDDYATWSVELPLAEGENTLTVTATDMAGNVNDGEAVNVRRAPITSAFPNDENPFEAPAQPGICITDAGKDIFVSDPFTQSIIAVSLYDGTRSVVSDNDIDTENLLEFPWGIHCSQDGELYITDTGSDSIMVLDPGTGGRTLLADRSSPQSYVEDPKNTYLVVIDDVKRLYVADRGKTYWINVESGEQVLLSDSGVGMANSNVIVGSAFGIAYDDARDNLILADADSADPKIVSVDVNSGARAILSESGYRSPNSVALDRGSDRAFIVDDIENKVFLINLLDGSSSVFSDATNPGTENATIEPWGIATHRTLGFLVAVDRELKAVLAIDLESGKRVIMSKSNH